MAEMTLDGDPSGSLAYGAANIASHYFSLDFIAQRLLPNLGDLFHVARKKIPHYDLGSRKMIERPPEPNGIKLEAFVFDAFGMLSSPDKMAVLQVPRDEEFAPVKNAAGQDSPQSARGMVSNLCRRWIEKAGGRLVEDNENSGGGGAEEEEEELLCEIVPATSYAGEGLETIVRERDGTISCPFLL
jgi:UDP-N-acetylglucosamine/UDP-N-acetylgalactosamine diphosphorylase